MIEAEDDEYEVRVFLSVNKENTEYYLEKPLKYFLEKTRVRLFQSRLIQEIIIIV